MGVMKQNRDVSRTQNLEFHQLYWRFMEKLLIVVGFGWKLDLDVLWSSGVIEPSGPPTRDSKKNGSIEPYEWRDPAMGGGKLSLQHNDPAMGGGKVPSSKSCENDSQFCHFSWGAWSKHI